MVDAPGHWWRCEQKRLDDTVKAFAGRLYCQPCFQGTGRKYRPAKVEQTCDAPAGSLLPGPDHYTWKRIVNRQRS